MRKRSTGFFNPGSVGGANASVGFNDESMTNPWDYVLMFEGTLLFAGAAARRLSPQSSPKAVFPFTVDNTAAGYGTSADSEYGGSARAEFWAPLWDQPANLNELTHLASEGRAQLGRRQVSNGTNFARAVAGLGTERGVSQFQRYGFLERNGLAFLAAPLGRFYIQDDRGTAQAANVLFDLDPWLESLRRAATGRNAPAGLGTALRQVEQGHHRVLPAWPAARLAECAAGRGAVGEVAGNLFASQRAIPGAAPKPSLPPVAPPCR